jgi:hypothetical protein
MAASGPAVSLQSQYARFNSLALRDWQGENPGRARAAQGRRCRLGFSALTRCGFTAADRESIDSCARMPAAIHRHAEMRG